MNLRALSLDKAKDQIERGFAAVALAAGDKPIAPFFRFPGLSDSGPLLAYLQQRGIAAFTVDVVSNDSYIGSPQRLAQRTIAQVEKQNGGIVLFHDIKASTAARAADHPRRAQEARLQDRAHALQDDVRAAAGTDRRARGQGSSQDAKPRRATAAPTEKPKLVPFYAAIAPTTLEAASEPAVTELAPDARERVHAGGTHATASAPVVTSEAADSAQPLHHAHAKHHGHRRGRVAGSDDPTSLSHVVSGGN